MRTWCSGTSRRPTRRGSRSEPDPAAGDRCSAAVSPPALLVPAVAARRARRSTIRMRGDARGAHVGFDPVGVRLRPGDTVRWLNVDPGNAHTATAYHPANFDRPRRIPAAATPWDSDYLLPEEGFAVTLTAEGIYDYFCVPHEHAGMVGRLIVGDPARRSLDRRPGRGGRPAGGGAGGLSLGRGDHGPGHRARAGDGRDAARPPRRPRGAARRRARRARPRPRRGGDPRADPPPQPAALPRRPRRPARRRRGRGRGAGDLGARLRRARRASAARRRSPPG